MNMLRMAVFCMTICWAGAAEWQFPEVGEQKVFFAAFRESVIGSGPQARVNPALTFDQEEKKDGYVQYTVSYAVDHDERISAYLLVPEHESGQKMPLMFCLHPTSRGGKDMVVGRHATAPADKAERKKWENRAYALELVKRGFVCFVPDRGGFGERSPLPDEPDPFRNMRVYQERLAKKYPNWSYPMGKVPWDLSCALDALLSFDFIDPARIGTVGHSLGGWDSLYFWGSDPRVKAAVINSGGGASDYSGRLDESGMADGVCPGEGAGFRQYQSFGTGVHDDGGAPAAAVYAFDAGFRDGLSQQRDGKSPHDPCILLPFFSERI